MLLQSIGVPPGEAISESVFSMSRDPREIISQSRMTILQDLIVLIAFGLNSLDGFDILSISGLTYPLCQTLLNGVGVGIGIGIDL
jgi:hypothetical protein